MHIHTWQALRLSLDMPFFIHPKSLSLLLFLILYTLADDSTPLGPQFQDPSSSAISFPHDIDNSNGLEVSGWTTAVELGDTGDNLFDQQGEFLTADDQTTSACAGSTSSQDGSPPTPKRRSRLLRKRDPPGFCSSQDYYQNDSAPSSSGGTSTTTTITNRKPGRPPGKTTPRAKPMQIQKALPLLGDPNSPLCNQYFPGVGSSYAVCYYPYFKTILRSPLVHVLSPCRACEFLIFLKLPFQRKSLDGRDVKLGAWNTRTRLQTPSPLKINPS